MRWSGFVRGLAVVVVTGAFVGVGVRGAAAQTWGQYGFTVTPLPIGFSNCIILTCVNDAGEVVGYVSVNGLHHAALWNGTNVQDLGTLGGNTSEAAGINNAGDVVGSSLLSDGATHAFLYNASGMQDFLGTFGSFYSGAAAINDAGQVAGTVVGQAFLYSAGSGQYLGNLGGLSEALALNNEGQVVGNSNIAGSTGPYHAFLYGGGSMQDLGTLGGSSSLAYGINDAGQVVGYSFLADGTYHAFLYGGGSMQDLGTLGGSGSLAYGISNAGIVAGYSYDSSGQLLATLWENGIPYALNSLVDPVDPGWNFTEAHISPGGTIDAAAFVNDTYENVVLKPNPGPTTVTPEPPSVLLLATGLIALAGFGLGRKRGWQIG